MQGLFGPSRQASAPHSAASLLGDFRLVAKEAALGQLWQPVEVLQRVSVSSRRRRPRESRHAKVIISVSRNCSQEASIGQGG